MIQFKRETWSDLEAALRREWLETNGLGGFASSTIIGLNTRRYHGLLVAATKPPVGRLVLLSKLEETLLIDGRRFDLSANRYPGVVHPQGFRYLKNFRLDPFPVFTYEVEGIEIEKCVFMIHAENSTVIHYQLRKNNHRGTEELPAGNPSVDRIPRLSRHDSRKRRDQLGGARRLWIGNCHSVSRVACPALGPQRHRAMQNG